MKSLYLNLVALLICPILHSMTCERPLIVSALETHAQEFKSRFSYKTPENFSANKSAYERILSTHNENFGITDNLVKQDPASLSPFSKELQTRLKALSTSTPAFIVMDTETTGFFSSDKLTEFAMVPVDSNLQAHPNDQQFYYSAFLEFSEHPTEMLIKAVKYLPSEISAQALEDLLKLCSDDVLNKEKTEDTLSKFLSTHAELKKDEALWKLSIQQIRGAFDRQTALTLNHYFKTQHHPNRLDAELSMARKALEFLSPYLDNSQKPVLIGQNIAFDLEKLTEFFERAYAITGEDGFLKAKNSLKDFFIIDTKVLYKLFWGRLLYARYWVERDSQLVPRNESKAEFMADLFNIDRSAWHGALFDSLGTLDLLKHILALDLDFYKWAKQLEGDSPETYAKLKSEMESIESLFPMEKLLNNFANPYSAKHSEIFPGAPAPKKNSYVATDREFDIGKKLWISKAPLGF
ncbi:MAG: hypothetical protein KA116_05290 [Proteobacteria bacterium]|nr:hypothetical protein [Pseudomonadota bacterium]